VAAVEPLVGTVDHSERADHALRRSQRYWLLSRLLAEVPNAERLAEALTAVDALLDRSTNLPVEVSALRRELAAAMSDPQAAAVAFTRYLILIPKSGNESFPFESHFREGTFPGDATRLVGEFMLDAGYEDLALDVASVDHLAAELRLMAFLCHAEYAAWRDGERAVAVASLSRQRNFLRVHLAAWAPEYCLALAGRADHGYIQAVAHLAAQTVRDDVAELAAVCTAVDADVAPGKPANVTAQ
jgi:TorA maturation chaperone TorD